MNIWEWIIDFERSWRLHFDLFGMTVDIQSERVFLVAVAATVLLLALPLVLISRSTEIRRRWMTWALIMPVVGIPLWFGRGSTAVLAAAMALLAVREFTRMAKLGRAETLLLFASAVGFPAMALWWPEALYVAAPLTVLASAIPSILQGDAENGPWRAAMSGFAAIWICWSLSHLVINWELSAYICFGAAAGDVAAWCGGKGLRRFAWARQPLSPLSPNKTMGGLVGAVVGTALVLLLLGNITVALVIAIGLGGVAGDLLESMFKRQAGVKDAGQWLPGFGGILDRVDSLLLALPLATLFT